MGIMVSSLLWVMQDLGHQPYEASGNLGFRAEELRLRSGSALCLPLGFGVLVQCL